MIYENYEHEQRDFIRRMNLIMLGCTKKSDLRRRMFSVKDSKGNSLAADRSRLDYDISLRACIN